MKPTFLILAIFGLFFSCNNTNTTKKQHANKAVSQQGETTLTDHQRQILIEELKRIRSIFAAKDKEKIADLFPFPLPDTAVGIFIDDSIYNEQFKEYGKKTTRTMFVRFFPEIAVSLQMEEVNQLFKYIKPEGLVQKDTLNHELRDSTAPCYKYYSITTEHDLVTLTTGSAVNDSYHRTSPASPDDFDENSSEFCEHVFWWEFRFDGKKLHFVKQHGAG